jgi:hypothetical protein
MNEFVEHLDTLVGPVISASVPTIYNHYLSNLTDDILNKPLYDYTPGQDMELYHSFYERTITKVKQLMIKDGYAELMIIGGSDFVIIFEMCDVKHYVTLAEKNYMMLANNHLGSHHTYRIKGNSSLKPWEVN